MAKAAHLDPIVEAEQTGRPLELNAPVVRNQALEEAEQISMIKALPGAAGALLIAWFIWTGLSVL